MSKVRFLVTGDFHSDISLVKKIKKNIKIEDLDFIVLVGDISDKRDDFKDLLSIFKNKPIILSPGNHETKKKLRVLKENYNVKLLNEEPFFIGSELVFFAPYDLEVGPYCKDSKVVLKNLKKVHQSIEHISKKILVSHLPPYGTKIASASIYFPFIGGSLGVKDFLDEKDDVERAFVGHIHESSGLEEKLNKTQIVNVGKTFKIFDFDFKTKLIKEVKD